MESGLPAVWVKVLDQLKVDEAARLQLELLQEVNHQAAAECVWKLSKEREGGIWNPSGFLSRCVTQWRKDLSKW